jgi:DoxX-like family
MTQKNTRNHGGESPNQKPAMTYVLWTVQGLVALVFLFAGGMKLMLPIEMMTKQMPLPGAFLRFIGTAEVLGGLGLVLPGILRVRQELTSMAAAGLIVIMAGATALTLAIGGGATALMPAVVGLLLAFVARKRWVTAPQQNFGGAVDLRALRSTL